MRNLFEGEKYLSASHGMVGILYMLLMAVKAVKELQAEEKLIASIRNTTLFIAEQIITNNGLMPEIEGKTRHHC